MLKYLKVKDIKNLKLLISGGSRKLWLGEDKIYQTVYNLKILDDLDLAQTSMVYF